MNQQDRDDADLVRAAQAGDREAFGELFRRHHADVRRVCVRRMVDPSEGDEVAQAAFVRAYERIGQCGADRRFGGWVQTIALRLCADAWRARSRTTSLDQPVTAQLVAADNCEEALLRREKVDCVRRAVSALPSRQRRVIVARDLEGRRPAEIAAGLAISLGAVDSLLLRARRRVALTYQGIAAEQGGVSTSVATAAAGTSAAVHPPLLGRMLGSLSRAFDAVTLQVASLGGAGPIVPRAAQQVAGVVVAAALSAVPVLAPDLSAGPGGSLVVDQLAPTVTAPLASVPLPALASVPTITTITTSVGPGPGSAVGNVEGVAAVPDRPPAVAPGAVPGGPDPTAATVVGGAAAAGELATATAGAVVGSAGALLGGAAGSAVLVADIIDHLSLLDHLLPPETAAPPAVP